MQQYLNVRQLADRYGVCVATIYNYIRAGKLPAGVHFGRIHRWNIADIEAFEQALADNQKGEITE